MWGIRFQGVPPRVLAASLAALFHFSHAHAIVVGDPFRSFDDGLGALGFRSTGERVPIVAPREPCIDPETGLPIVTLPAVPPPESIPEAAPPRSRTVGYMNGAPVRRGWMLPSGVTGLLPNPRCYGPDKDLNPCAAPPATWFHRWPVEADIARHSVYNCLWQQNQEAIRLFISERERYPNQEVWTATVPGMSYGAGGHGTPCPPRTRAGILPPCTIPNPPGNISGPFKERLTNAYRLLRSGAVRFLLLSGGIPDPERPEYVEATEGLGWIKWAIENRIDGFEDGWPGPESIDSRFFVDPVAEHSTTNIGNADRFYRQLGMRNSLVVTDMVPCAHDSMQRCGIADSFLSKGQQAYYFQGEGARSIYASGFKSDMGFTPGAFHYQGVPISRAPVVTPSILPFRGTRHPVDETFHTLLHFENEEVIDANLWSPPARGGAVHGGYQCNQVRSTAPNGTPLPQL